MKFKTIIGSFILFLLIMFFAYIEELIFGIIVVFIITQIIAYYNTKENGDI